jgi:cellulose synthase/poly-beta-1,6-N-acetylglucosamine synthase-like glycosyltransferase
MKRKKNSHIIKNAFGKMRLGRARLSKIRHEISLHKFGVRKLGVKKLNVKHLTIPAIFRIPRKEFFYLLRTNKEFRALIGTILLFFTVSAFFPLTTILYNSAFFLYMMGQVLRF